MRVRDNGPRACVRARGNNNNNTKKSPVHETHTPTRCMAAVPITLPLAYNYVPHGDRERVAGGRSDTYDIIWVGAQQFTGGRYLKQIESDGESEFFLNIYI